MFLYNFSQLTKKSAIIKSFIFTVNLLVGLASAQVQRQFLAVDNGNNNLLFIDQKDTSQSWSISIPGGSRDIQILGDNRILIGHGNGFAEYDFTGKQLKSVTSYSSIQTVRRLPNGHTILGGNIGGGGTYYELDVNDTQVDEYKFDGIQEMRLVRVLSNGNLMFTSSGPFRVIEGERGLGIAKETSLPGKGYLAFKNSQGNILASTGDDSRIIEMDVNGTIVSYAGGKADHPTLNLDFFSGFDTLSNGSRVIAHWLGHLNQAERSIRDHIIEFDGNNQVVWKWSDHVAASQITNMYILGFHENDPERFKPVQSVWSISKNLEVPEVRFYLSPLFGDKMYQINGARPSRLSISGFSDLKQIYILPQED